MEVIRTNLRPSMTCRFMDLEVIRSGKGPDDDIHERAGFGDPLWHAVIEVRVGVKPHPARLRSAWMAR